MAKQLQLRRGTSAENDAFKGAPGEVTYDTTNKTIRIHDGSNFGGSKIDLAENVVHKASKEKITGEKIFNVAPRLSDTLAPSTTTTKESNIEDVLLQTSLNTSGKIDGASIIRLQDTNGNRSVVYRAGFRKSDDSGSLWPSVVCGVHSNNNTYITLTANKNYGQTPGATEAYTSAELTTIQWVNNPDLSKNVVHRSGSELIKGQKYFSDHIIKKCETVTRGTAVTADTFNAINFTDKNNIWLGGLEYYTRTDKSCGISLILSDMVGNTTNTKASIKLSQDSAGNVKIESSVKPGDNDNSNQIATTSYVRGYVNNVFAGTIFTPGMIMPYGGSTAPTGWLMCNGQTYSRTTYANLYNKIGTNYGAGDGSTTFAVPNFTNRVAQGLGRGYVSAGLPNIKGSMTRGEFSDSQATGAFYYTASGRGHVGDHSGSDAMSLNFNASLYNSIYSDSVTTVQPASVKTYWIIKY